MALYPKAIQKPIPPGPNDPRIKPRVVILHVAESEASSLYGWFNGPSGGVESHFYIRRDGTVEQYRDTSVQADANTDANDFAISIETQGMERGEWTPQQIAAIKALLTWCHTTHGIPLVRCPAWDGSGVGYHTQYPGRWDKRGATCPGPDRKLQFNQVLDPWMREGGDKDDLDMTPAERKALIDDIATAVVNKPVPRPGNTPVALGAQVGAANVNAWRVLQLVQNPAKLTDAVVAAVKAADPGVDVDSLAKAIVVEFGKTS